MAYTTRLATYVLSNLRNNFPRHAFCPMKFAKTKPFYKNLPTCNFPWTVKIIRHYCANVSLAENIVNAETEKDSTETYVDTQNIQSNVSSNDVEPEAHSNEVNSSTAPIIDERFQKPRSFEPYRQVKQYCAWLLEDFTVQRTVDMIVQLDEDGYQYATKIIDAVVSALLEEDRLTEAVELVKLWVTTQSPVMSHTYTKVLRKFNIKIMSPASTGKGLVKEYLAFNVHMQKNNNQSDEHQRFQILRMSSWIGNVNLAQACYDSIKASSLCTEETEAGSSTWFGTSLDMLLLKAYCNDAQNRNNFEHNNIVLKYFNELLSTESYETHPKFLRYVCRYAVHAGIAEEVRESINGTSRVEDKEQFEKYLDTGLIRVYMKRGERREAQNVINKSKFPGDAKSFMGYCIANKDKL